MSATQAKASGPRPSFQMHIDTGLIAGGPLQDGRITSTYSGLPQNNISAYGSLQGEAAFKNGIGIGLGVVGQYIAPGLQEQSRNIYMQKSSHGEKDYYGNIHQYSHHGHGYALLAGPHVGYRHPIKGNLFGRAELQSHFGYSFLNVSEQSLYTGVAETQIKASDHARFIGSYGFSLRYYLCRDVSNIALCGSVGMQYLYSNSPYAVVSNGAAFESLDQYLNEIHSSVGNGPNLHTLNFTAGFRLSVF